jgi:hypothetical protein
LRIHRQRRVFLDEDRQSADHLKVTAAKLADAQMSFDLAQSLFTQFAIVISR